MANASPRKAFLSSTAVDLAEQREAVCEAIQGLDGWQCVRMEEFGSRDSVPLDFCISKVRECDVLVAIAGCMPGSSPPGHGKSYTEREYEAAVEASSLRLGREDSPAGFVEALDGGHALDHRVVLPPQHPIVRDRAVLSVA